MVDAMPTGMAGAIAPTRLDGVFSAQQGRRTQLYTKSFAPGKQVYDEFLVSQGDAEYREWNPLKSKLCAAILKGVSQIGVKSGKSVLYLGSSTGTTVSHVSDIVAKDGCIFALDNAPRVMRELVFLCEARKNIAPILASAAQPDEYAKRVFSVDVVYQDIAQRNQVDIFLRNTDRFLKSSGFGLLVVKARSIDVSKHPKELFRQVKARLEAHKGLTIVDYRELEPFQRDHAMFVCKKA